MKKKKGHAPRSPLQENENKMPAPRVHQLYAQPQSYQGLGEKGNFSPCPAPAL